jgi:hypothetical protein
MLKPFLALRRPCSQRQRFQALDVVVDVLANVDGAISKVATQPD